MRIAPIALLVAFPFAGAAARAEVVNVSTASQLADALANAFPGDDIVLKAGTYAGPFELDDAFAVRLRGPGNGGKAVLSAANVHALRVGSSEHVDLKDLEFDCPQGTPLEVLDSSDVRVLDCRVSDALSTGILVSASESVWIDGCTIEGTSIGILGRGNGHYIHDTTVLSPAQDGMRFESAADCVIEDCTVKAAGSAGIFLGSSNKGAARMVVADCEVLGALTGIRVGDFASSALVRRCRVVNSKGNLERGMFVEAGALGVVLEGNRVDGATDAGIDLECDAAVLSGNEATHCTSAGIRLVSQANSNLLHDNRATHCGGPGFLIDGGANALIRNQASDDAGGAIAGFAIFLSTFTQNGFDPFASGAPGDTLRVPGDFATIQAAIDQAAAGDTILIGKGTWHESLIVDSVKQVTLRGKGKVVIDGGTDPALGVTDCNRFRIEGLVLRADFGAPLLVSDSTGTRIEDCAMIAPTGFKAVSITDCSATSIVDCKIEGSDQIALVLDGFSNLVERTTVDGGRGIHVRGGLSVVADCRVTNSDDDGILIESAMPDGTRTCLLMRNRIEDFPLYGMHLGDGSFAVAALDNRFKGGKSGMLVPTSAEHSIVAGNRIAKSGVSGIACSGLNAVLDANRISGPGDAGIESTSVANFALWSRNAVKKSASNGFIVGNEKAALVRNASKGSAGQPVELPGPGSNVLTANRFD